MHFITTCNETKGLYDRIIITMVLSYTRMNITRLLPLALLLMAARNSPDSNELVAFSSIALYYDDAYAL